MKDDIDKLIEEGERLKSLPHDDPDQALWDNELKAFVSNYGKETLKILLSIINPRSAVLHSYPNELNEMRIEEIIKVQKLLESLKKRDPEHLVAQSNTIALSFDQAKKQVKDKVTNNTTYNINGSATFGPDSPISQISIGEFMASLEKEIQEKVTDEKEKNRLLETIRSVTTDPSFKAVAITATSEIIKKLLGG